MARVLDSLSIGDAVRFNADLLGAVISSDDQMVLQPRVIAAFSKISRLSDAAPQ